MDLEKTFEAIKENEDDFMLASALICFLWLAHFIWFPEIKLPELVDLIFGISLWIFAFCLVKFIRKKINELKQKNNAKNNILRCLEDERSLLTMWEGRIDEEIMFDRNNRETTSLIRVLREDRGIIEHGTRNGKNDDELYFRIKDEYKKFIKKHIFKTTKKWKICIKIAAISLWTILYSAYLWVAVLRQIYIK